MICALLRGKPGLKILDNYERNIELALIIDDAIGGLWENG